MSMALLGIMAASLVGSIISAAVSYNTAEANRASQEKINAENVKAQQQINDENVQAQKEINQQNIDYSREFAQNSIQWKMDDLEAAGLNPTLAAGGFGGSASPTAMSAPTQKAAMQQAPMLDLNGVSSAINAMSNMALTGYLMDQRNNNYSNRTETLAAKKAMDSKNMALGNAGVGNAKQVASTLNNANWSKDWDKLLKDLSKGNFK